MAVTNEKSTQVTNQDATPQVKNAKFEEGGMVKYLFFSFTQGVAAGDAGSTATLCRIPGGQGKVLPKLSHIAWAAFGAARTLDVGIAAHTKRDGTTQSAQSDVIDDGRDVSSAGNGLMGAGTNGAQSVAYDIGGTTGQVARADVVATVAGGTIPAGTTLTGWIAYVPNE